MCACNRGAYPLSETDVMEPLMLRPKEAFAAIGVKTTRGYELIAAGELEALKCGRMTLIPVSSIKAFAARLVTQKEGA